MPEFLLAVFALGALLAAVYTGKDAVARPVLWATCTVFLVLALMIGFNQNPAGTAFGGLFVDDAFSRFGKVVILVSAAAVLAMSADYMTRRGLMRFEYPILVALSVIGMMMMVSAGDLMSLYMGLELQSLALYVIAALRRDSVKSSEAGLKYFVLGALSSGILLYGASLVYGFAGTTSFAGIMSVVDADHLSMGVLFGLVFVITGMAFKLSAVPFHMWAPDVYEGSPTPVTAFFATAPKMAAMGLLARVMFDAFGDVTAQWGQIIAFLAVASMFVGSIAAIGQTNIKRLMAYSSIAHMGFAMLGLLAGTAQGAQATLIYMAVYVVMNIGTFAFILSMERDGAPVTDIRSLGQFAKREPVKGLALLVLMFSLAGIPPFAGFLAKYAVFSAAVASGYVLVAVLGVIASAIGAYYYLRIVYYMYFGEEGEALNGKMPMMQWGMLIGAALFMLLGVVSLFGIGDAAMTAAVALVG